MAQTPQGDEQQVNEEGEEQAGGERQEEKPAGRAEGEVGGWDGGAQLRSWASCCHLSLQPGLLKMRKKTLRTQDPVPAHLGSTASFLDAAYPQPGLQGKLRARQISRPVSPAALQCWEMRG